MSTCSVLLCVIGLFMHNMSEIPYRLCHKSSDTATAIQPKIHKIVHFSNTLKLQSFSKFPHPGSKLPAVTLVNIALLDSLNRF